MIKSIKKIVSRFCLTIFFLFISFVSIGILSEIQGYTMVDGKEMLKNSTVFSGFIIGGISTFILSKRKKNPIRKHILEGNKTENHIWFDLYEITDSSIDNVEQLYDNEAESYNYNDLKLIDRKKATSDGFVDFKKLKTGKYILVRNDDGEINNPRLFNIDDGNKNLHFTSKKDGSLQKNHVRKTEKELLYLNNISKIKFDQAFNLYNRSIFKERLNPTIREDFYTIEMNEFKLLNDLGLVSQEISYPYMITILTDEFDLRMAKGFTWYEKNRKTKIPNSNKLDNLQDGFQFEEYVANLLRRLNYKNVEVLPMSNDYGADVLAEMNGTRYAIQCKYYSSTVGVSSVQEILGGTKYHNAHVSIVATNNMFTSNAKKLAEANNVILWDRKNLLKMIEQVN